MLSTPRLTTQNNVAAEVGQGIQIPIQTVANNTVTVSFKEALLKLMVTPQITAAGTVIMQVTIENASADFSRQVNGIPPIDTQRAQTQVQVNDGATTVIGGIFVSREQSFTDRTPLVSRIPLLGWLFRRDSVQDESRELLIFITPQDPQERPVRTWIVAIILVALSSCCGTVVRKGTSSSFLIIDAIEAAVRVRPRPIREHPRV